MPELVGHEICGSSDDRFFRVSDKLYPYSKDIERFINQRQGELFNLDRTVLLYDLTNTHFEGQCKKNKKARYGKNKQKRSDCPQIVVGMAFDREGFELAHKIFEGNQSDSTSLLAMIDALESRFKDTDPQLLLTAKPLVIVDAGIGTNDNLKLLRDKGFSYLVNDRRRQRSHYADEFAMDETFEVVGNREDKMPVLVKTLRTMERHGDHRSWDTLKRILSTHSYATIVLPTKSGVVYRIRKAGEPDQVQRQIYNSLGIDWRVLPRSRTVLDTKNEATL